MTSTTPPLMSQVPRQVPVQSFMHQVRHIATIGTYVGMVIMERDWLSSSTKTENRQQPSEHHQCLCTLMYHLCDSSLSSHNVPHNHYHTKCMAQVSGSPEVVHGTTIHQVHSYIKHTQTLHQAFIHKTSIIHKTCHGEPGHPFIHKTVKVQHPGTLTYQPVKYSATKTPHDHGHLLSSSNSFTWC